MPDYGHDELVERLLAHIERHGDDERLRELAGGLRRGRAGWAESLSSSAYTDALQPKLDGFAGWYQSLSETERAAEAARCDSELEKLNEQTTGEQERMRPPPG